MNLYAITYKNIGPFEGKLITINFKSGKFLINAPIGTGKSFLFFDGPVFGLYKYSSRNMLNRKSQDGYVKILFESNGEYFLVERFIKPTNSGGESVQSSLFKLSLQSTQEDSLPHTLSQHLSDIINPDIDIFDIVKKDYDLAEINFKSQTELQKTLEDFLQPKEVFLNTSFLMQDSDNIFEMIPTDRISVFKNIFGLIGIDSAKDLIADKKKEIQNTIKIKQDNLDMDLKLKSYIAQIMIKRGNISNILKSFGNDSFVSHFGDFFASSFFSDLELFGEKINIENFDLTHIDFDQLKKIFKFIDEQKDHYQQILGKSQSLKANYEKLKSQISLLKNEKENIENQKIHIENKINNANEKSIDDLKKQKQNLINNQNTIIQSIDFDIIKKYDYDVSDIFEVNSLIDNLTEQGKTISSEVKSLDLQLQNIQSTRENKISKFDIESNSFDQQIEKLQKQIENLQKKEILIDQNLEQEGTFFCEKIKLNCPYIEKIKLDSIKMIKDQKILLQKEKIELDNDVLLLRNKIELIKNQKELLQNNPDIDLIESLQKKKQTLNDDIEKLKNFFADFKRKELKDNFVKYKEYDKLQKQIDIEILKYEEEIQKVKQYKEHLISLDSSIKSIIKQIDFVEKEQSELYFQIANYDKTIDEININTINEIDSELKNLDGTIKQINLLIADFKKKQIEVEKFKQDEKIYTDLYQIFSKELMLVVLQDFLPTLADVINNLLAQVVSYELRFDLIKSSKDKLELEIQILDEKGLRGVKSLSGGQKTILKLVWILAVSSMINSKFLFLDETINNLDYDTVGKVAVLLEDFIKTHNMKFYVVTHSRQIQDMNIWDKIVVLN